MESPVPNANRKHDRSGGGISLETLIIASLASAAASFAASRIWGTGTLISAAATPVIVAFVSEFLRHARPRQRVRPPAPIRPNADRGTITYYSNADKWRPRWRPALVTGLLAFAIVVALYTVPDLLAGRSITGNGQPTTFFGDSANVKKKTSPTTTVTATTTTTKTTPTTTATTTTTKTTPTTTPTTTTTNAALTTTVTGGTSTPNTTTPTNTYSTTTSTTSTAPPTVNLTTTQTTPAP